jgi:disulfide bond formation protein DsbB
MKMRLVAGGAALLLALTAAACSDDKDTTTPATEADGGGSESTDGGAEDNGGGGGGDAAAGAEVFAASCASCHGADAKGLPNLGKDLTASEFVSGMSDEELVAFIAVGRAADAEDNTTGVAMPPKGGNPALSDEDLANVVAHIRSIQE